MTQPMYSVSVEACFSARHSVQLPDGNRESSHDHDWLVRAIFAARELGDGCMVVDFGEAKDALRDVLSRLHDADLNSLNGLSGKNPTAEVLARYVFDEVRSLGGALSTIRRVEVVEAPGCVAAYELLG